MAAKRLSRSAVNWTEFYQMCPKHQQDQVRMIKAKTDNLVSKITVLPENLPKIDWENYKKIVPNAALVEKFQKEYEAATVQFPKDSLNWKACIDEQEKRAREVSKQYVSVLQEAKQSAKEMLDTLDKLPKDDELISEVQYAFFPETKRQIKEPTDFPFAPENFEDKGPFINRNKRPFFRYD